MPTMRLGDQRSYQESWESISDDYCSGEKEGEREHKMNIKKKKKQRKKTQLQRREKNCSTLRAEKRRRKNVDTSP